MQTSISLARLADPDVAESEKILRTCVHCGFCTATCPTYVLLGDERDSPRGRIYLIKDMLDRDAPASAEVVTHLDRCLSCLSCMTTCPSGVHYMHLIDYARVHVERTYRRPPVERLIRDALAALLPHDRRFRAAVRMARLAKPLAPLMEWIGLRPLAAMLRLAPARLPKPTMPATTIHPAAGLRRGRVALMAGCVSPVIAPSINEAAIRVLTRHGIDVVLPKGQGCCGSVVQHLGRAHGALAAARSNVDAWIAEADRNRLDAILITASGCGTTVKDYGYMLRSDRAYAAKAARVSALAKDVCEYLVGLDLHTVESLPALTTAYHGACSLQHGQKITWQPKELLCRTGFVVEDVPEGHLCCGSAGTYNILEDDIAKRLRTRKVANIEKVEPDVIAAGNIGCITQIAAGTSIPVVHPVELIDWATGGPQPAALRGTD
ncbi:MAG: glycolate oxidase subunit GlcF [Hyphomicrobiales bacterium]|nr:glycolate oxidase subunit GlcF [Hyphomicrobiales bacterium]